jgi:flagellar biosynthetic protein FliR
VAKFQIGLQEFWGFALVLVRTGAILSAFPLIGSRMVPMRVRAAMVFAVALAFGPLVAPTLQPDWLEPVRITIGLARELFIGLFLGFATRCLMAIIEIAGSIMGFQLGFGMAVQLDPVTQVEVPVVGSFLVIVASLLYFVVDGHHLLLLALGSSFALIPPLGAQFHPPLLVDAVEILQRTFEMGVKLALPLMGMTFLIYLVLGILGRVMPQMNVLFLGFPLTISVGLLVLGFGLPLFSSLFQQSIVGLEGMLVGMLEEMGRG